MNGTEIIRTIVEICVLPLLGIATRYLVMWLQAKSLELKAKTDSELVNKYITMINDTVCTCVIATNQTYVDALKEQDLFNAEAQKEALQKTLNAVIANLSNDAKEYIKTISEDLNTYLIPLIESKVNLLK